MSKKQRKRRNHKPDLHLHLGPTAIKDRAAAEASCAIDAAADRKWFQQRPDLNERQRPCSPREIAANGCPPDSTVRVIRGPMGSQIRMILAPDPERN
jgi:hypothetical protein